VVLESENRGESGECVRACVWPRLGAALDHLLLFWVVEQTQWNACRFGRRQGNVLKININIM
jgi:hypothetical protein